MPDQFEQYYKYLKDNGADVAPDFNSFKNTLSNYDNASKYYSYLKDNDFDVPASYDSFADTFGLKKKDGGIVSSPIPSKLPSKGVLEQGLEMATKGFAVKPQEQSTFSKVEQSLGKVKKAYDAIQFLQNAPPEFGGVSKEDEKLANQNYANAEKEKQNLLKTYSEDIYSNVDELLASNGYKNLFEGDVFNTEKARSILDTKVKEKGGGSFLRETLLAELKKRAQSDFDKPVMDQLVQQEFKNSGINVNSLMSKYGQDLFNKLSAKQQSILPIIKQEAEKESAGALNNAKEIATSLGSDFTNYVNDLNNKIKAGQIDEQTAKQLFDNKKSEYDNGLAQLNEDYQKMVRNVNVKINDRFGRIENEMKKISNSITSEDVFKALPAKDRQKIEEVYSRASQKLAERKNQVVRSADEALGLPTFASKALISGFNKGLADLGGYLQMNGSDNKFTDWLLNREQTAEGTAIGQYEWNGKDWYKRAIGGSMQSMGASAPMLLPSLAIGLATEGAALPAVSGALAGYVGYKGESMQNAGDAYKQKLAETGDVNKAYESAARVEQNNKISLPFYFIGGLGTMKLLQGGGKVGSLLTGAALEQAEEIPTEYIQQYNQAKENGYKKGIGSFIMENPEIAVDTLVTTLGQSGAMSAVGKAIGKIDASASQPTTQFYADLIKNEGIQFANSVLQNYYNTGVIDEKKFQEQKMELLKVAQSMQKVQNLGVSPEKSQVVTILNANVEDLKKQVEEETDQAAKVILEGKLRQAQADLRGISDNTTPYIVLTLPGGQNSTRIMTMQEYEQLKEEGKIDGIIQAADKVRVVNDEELNTEVNKIKEEVGNPEGVADGAYTGGAPAEEFEPIVEVIERPEAKPIEVVEPTEIEVTEEVKPTEVKEQVNIVKLTDLPDRAFAVGMTVEKFEDLKSKIQKEGFTQPIIIDKESGNVLDGQSRLLAAQDLGIKDVPSIYMDNPTKSDLNEKIKELEKQYIPSQEVKPTEVKKERAASVEPELPEGGLTIVTETGLTEDERRGEIEKRKSSSQVSDETLERNSIIRALALLFPKNNKGKIIGARERNTSEAIRKINELKLRANKLGLSINTQTGSLVKKFKKMVLGKETTRTRKIAYDNKADSDMSIDESGKTLYERDSQVQSVFKELIDNGHYLDFKDENGVRYSASQLDATIKDILDGIPSKRANRYLDEVETSIKNDEFFIYDKALGEFNPTYQDLMGLEKENIGEPMTEEEFDKYLNDESNLTPEQEEQLTDNVENLLNEYENEQPETGFEGEVQQSEQKTEKGVPSEVEQTAKPTSKLQETKGTLAEEYESIPKGNKLSTKNAIKALINDNFEEIKKQLENKKICQ
jgi:hypothetical protein